MKNIKKVSHKKEIRSMFKQGFSIAKIGKKFKLSDSGVRWHLNN